MQNLEILGGLGLGITHGHRQCHHW